MATLPCAVLAAACEAPGNSRSIMSGMPGHYPGPTSTTPAAAAAAARHTQQQHHLQQQQQGVLEQADSFTNFLRTAAWAQQPEQLQQPTIGSPRSSKAPAGAYGSSASDTQLRRDIDYSSFGGALPPQLQQLQQVQQQQLGGSSGPGSDTAGSVQHQAQQQQQDEEPKPVKRGRGRQRKNTGVETAQQRAHRRFYERKKQRMASLEQEAREKQEEYQQLLALNTELRRKHEALQRAVAGRDEHLVLIQTLGSLSLDASMLQQALQHHQHQHHQGGGAVGQPPQLHMPTVQEQPPQQQVHQDPQQQQPHQQQPGAAAAPQHAEPPSSSHHQRSKSSPMQPPQQSNSWAHPLPHDSSDMHRSGSAPGARAAQQQPPDDLMPEVEEAGPFGMIQLPQYGSADDDALPVVPADRAASGSAAAAVQPSPLEQQPQQQQDTQQQMSWVAQQQQQQQHQWPAGSFLDLLEGPGMSLTRSLSMPARTGGLDTDMFNPDTFLHQHQHQGLGLGAPQPSRSFTTTPHSWNARAGPLRAGGAAAAGELLDWELGGGPFAAAAPGQPPLQQLQQPLLPPGSSRHHSWSGATGGEGLLPANLLPRDSLSFGVEPVPAAAGAAGAAVAAAAAASSSQQQQQQQQPGGSMWGTVTTAGPLVGGQPLQQQQPAGVAASGSMKGEQLMWPDQQQQQQQQSGLRLAPPQPAFPGFMPPPQPQQPLHMRRSALQQHAAPQQVVQQLQQMGDMAFSSDLTVQLATADMPDDVLLLDRFGDADMMDMLIERMSQQQSFEMLSPLPSIPSALLTGDSLRAAMADTAALAAAGLGAAPQANPSPLGLAPALTQQQHQQGLSGAAAAAGDAPGLPGLAVPAAGGNSRLSRQSSPGSPTMTLLEASRQLQARHIAAGFYPSRSANEMFYVHEMVDWYKDKLLQLQQLLPYVDRPCPDVACGVSLVQTMEEVIDGVRKFGTRNRIGMWELKLINLETGDCQEAPPEHWAMVADRIQLPPQMRESAMACYSLYVEYVDKVKEDRVAVLRDFQLLEQQLAATAAHASQAQGSGGAAPRSVQFRVDGYDQYQALIERLQLSLKREHMVANMLSYSLSQIASHVQMAKGMLSCWPYWPDGPSVLSVWLAEEQQAAAANQQQRAGPQRASAAGGAGSGGGVSSAGGGGLAG